MDGVVTRVFVIAEAGVNHNGDVAIARRLVDAAVEAGADAVKFQTFRAELLARRDTPKAAYQTVTTGVSEGQYEMLRRLELNADAHRVLRDHAVSRGIAFLSTPFDEDSADLLDGLGVPLFKVPSGEITNLLLLRHIAAKAKPVILSTGMATLEEIDGAVQVLKRGGVPKLTILHCVSDYPTRPEDLNLRMIVTLRERYSVDIGLSDHTAGIAIAMAAVALGAAVIEKHVTLDRSMPGPDHRASIEPGELAAMVAGIREVEAALGNGMKRITEAEAETRSVARRSLVFALDLDAGTVREAGHLAAKRPGTGISPMQLDKVIGRRLKRRVVVDAMITWDVIE